MDAVGKTMDAVDPSYLWPSEFRVIIAGRLKKTFSLRVTSDKHQLTLVLTYSFSLVFTVGY